jgi:peptidyl-prolyl cis-trans isomerase SurA
LLSELLTVKFIKRLLGITLALLLLLTFTGCTQSTPEENDDAVAVVNGTEISRADYTHYPDQVKQMYAQQGVDMDDPAMAEMVAIIEEQVLDEMINELLFLQEATKAGTTPSEEDIQANIDHTRDAFESEEAFEQALAEIGMTLDDFRQDITEQLTIQAYIDSQREDYTPADDEIENLYNEYSAQFQDMPELEEVRSLLADEIIEEKNDQIIFELLETLRREADIQINL